MSRDLVDVTFRCGNTLTVNSSVLDEYDEDHDLFPEKGEYHIDVMLDYFEFFLKYEYTNIQNFDEYLRDGFIIKQILENNKESKHRIYGREREFFIDWIEASTRETIEKIPRDLIMSSIYPEIHVYYLMALCSYYPKEKHIQQIRELLKEITTVFKQVSSYEPWIKWLIFKFGWCPMLMDYIKKRNPSLYSRLEQHKPKCEKLE